VSSPEHAPPIAAIVVVTHNSSQVIPGWLDAVEALAETNALELCVVDSGSSEEELQVLRDQVGGRVGALVTLPNVGFGRACNAGAEATSAPVLLFTNPDTRVLSLPAAVQAGEPIDGSVLGAYCLEPDGSRSPLGFRHFPMARLEARNLLLGGHTDTYPRTADNPEWVLGAALAVSRTDFKRIGGFYSGLFLYFEDADLCAVHVERGGRIALDTGFVVEHKGADSSQPRYDVHLDGVARQSGRIFAARHGRRWHAAALYALFVLWYVPRRVAFALVRRALGRYGKGSIRVLVRDLLLPGRVIRRLGAESAHRDTR